MRASRENAKPSLMRRALACLVSAAMVVAFTPVVAWGASNPSNLTFDIAEGDVTIGRGTDNETIKVSYVSNSSPTTTSNISSDQTITIFSSVGSNTPVQHSIAVGGGVTAKIKLSGVNIDVSSRDNTCAFSISNSSTVNLTLAKTNTLQSGMNTAGLQVPSGSSLTIAGSGSLTATGGDGGAGIGGGFDGAGGNITIRGGTVCAYGGKFGAGIGGGNCGFGRYITITGGTVCAYGGDGAAGIGGGASIGGNIGDITVSGGTVTAAGGTGGAGIDGIFKTESNGNAVVYASSISGNSATDGWSGVIFEGVAINKDSSNNVTITGGTGQVYGTSAIEPGVSFEVPSGSTLTVPDGKTLTIAKDTTLAIASDGTLTNSGKIYVDGSLAGTASANGTNGAVYYLLTLNANEGTVDTAGTGIVEGPNSKQYYNSTTGATLPTLTKTGHTFGGWYSNETFTGDRVTAVTAAETGTKTYWAKWEANSYTITFDLDGGTGTTTGTTTITQKFGTAITAPENPTKTGYTFVGWDTTIPATMPAGDMTIKAKWQPIKYTISFEPNGGTTVAAISEDFGKKVTKPADPTKTGYSFAGWYKDSELTRAWVFDTDTVPVYGTTLYAKWTVNKYTITFDTDGGTTVDPITQDYGTAVTAPDNPSKKGYTFKCWSEDVPATMPAENKTLTAQWTRDTYTITYVLDGGTNDSSNPDAYTVESDTITLKPGKKSGYAFAGWYEGDSKVEQIAKGSVGNKTLTAKWNYVPPSDPSYNLPATVKGGIAVKVTISGSTAVVAEISASALESAAGSGAASITIDLSGLPKGVTQAQLSKTTVDKLLGVVKDAGNAVESVTVNLGGAVLTLDAKALAAVAEQVKGTNVTLGVKESTPDSLNSAQRHALSPFEVVQLYFVAEIKSGGAEIHDFGGGFVRVSVAFEPKPGHNPARYVVLYVGADGAIERYATAWAGGMLSFMAPHFSTYAVVYVEDATQAAIDALEALPDAGKLKTKDAEAAVKRAEAALAQVAALDDGQKMLVDETLVANAESVVKRGNVLVAAADKKAVGKVKDKAFSVKAGSSKSIAFKTKMSAAGTKVVYKKSKGSKYISVTKAGKVTAKKGMKKGKTYTAKVKVTCGASSKTVTVTVTVRVR